MKGRPTRPADAVPMVGRDATVAFLNEPLRTGLVLSAASIAIARTVAVRVSSIGSPTYVAELRVGVLPSVV